MVFSHVPVCNGTRIPKEDRFLSDASRENVCRMIKKTSPGKAWNILVACCRYREGNEIRSIARELMRPYSTVRGILLGRPHQRRSGCPQASVVEAAQSVADPVWVASLDVGSLVHGHVAHANHAYRSHPSPNLMNFLHAFSSSSRFMPSMHLEI